MVRAVRWEGVIPAGGYQPGGASVPVGGCNSGGKNARAPQGARCIADKCAMWRWSPETELQPAESPNGARIWESRAVKVRGYCGIAGRPEIA